MEVRIQGIITCNDLESFNIEFIEWLESKGYAFGGGIGEYKEDDDCE